MGQTQAEQYILAIDQGTTSSRAILYDTQLNALDSHAQEFSQHFPRNGWVEHDPEDLWQTTLGSIKKLLAKQQVDASCVRALGITNQRETTLLWNRQTGTVLYNAIVWQDRRTASYCNQLKEAGHEADVTARTGLLLDPYFSATKLRWLLDHVDGAREAAEKGELCFGTVECFLLWRLTGGKVHATDASNASRTLLMNIHTRQWDPQLLQLFDIPASLLPEIRDNAADFGTTESALLGAKIPICAMVGDQQGALIGQACTEPGMLKSTYGTGCFALLNTGSEPVQSNHRLLTTLAYQLQGKPVYALEGSIFMAGAIIQWLRDSLGVLQNAAESEPLAQGVDYEQSEILVPAFTGLGAPYWDPDARAALFGMTRDTGRKQLAAAALKSVALQSQDLLQAMADDGQAVRKLRVDGGMTDNRWFLQVLSDITGLPVERATNSEATAMGAAFLAGLQAGVFESLDDIHQLHSINADFRSQIDDACRGRIRQRWLAAVAKIR